MRAYYSVWYRALVTTLPEIVDGFITVPSEPGLGTELLPGLHEREDGRCE